MDFPQNYCLIDKYYLFACHSVEFSGSDHRSIGVHGKKSTAVIFGFNQNGEDLGNSRSSVRHEMPSAHKFYSIGF